MMTERELDHAPSMLPLFARAGVAMIPGAGRLPWCSGGGGDVPDQVLTLTDVHTDRDRLAAYDRVCGFALGETLPPTYPHMLAFPLHLALITGGDFPFPAIGLVHITNRIVVHRPITASEPLSLRVWAGPLQPHPSGTQFAIHTEVRAGEELVWKEVSTNLRRGGGSGEGGERSGPPSSRTLPATATWQLREDLGRRYAGVSGDYNPIHVHSLSARLFGFPSAIAHGMWTKARCLAALGASLPDAYTVEVAFKRPILLPATVTFAESRDRGEVRFGVRDAQRDKTHLDGLLTR